MIDTRQIIRFWGILGYACALAHGQSLMSSSGSQTRIYNTDAAVLESQDPRSDLPCSATLIKPTLGFDLKFHAGYEVTVPLRELSGNENLLTMVFRVVPEGHKDEPVYLSQRITVPDIEADARGEAFLQGNFELGEGKYHIDWLMRDRTERVCSNYWDMDAELPVKDKNLKLMIAAGTIEPPDKEPFKPEPPVDRQAVEGPINVKLMVNFAPQNARSATLQPLDVNALVSILRNIAREPRITRFSMVAFNMQEQRVLYRQENAELIDFPALGDALQGLNLGTVDLKKLGNKNGDTDFLTNLITDEMRRDHPDAMIFAGPKVMMDVNVPQESLRQVGEPEYPVFYMNYNLNPQNNPWRDAIGTAVRHFKGAEYTISRPRDLWFAWNEIMSRILKVRFGKRAATASTQ